MTGHPNGEQSRDELVRALELLARSAPQVVTGCHSATVSLVREGALSTVAATERRVALVDEAQYQRGDGPCLDAMRRRAPVTVEDYGSDERWPEVAAEAVRAGVRSSHSLPLLDDAGDVVGGLNLYGTRPRAFTESSHRTAVTLAQQAALVLGYLRLLHTERAARARDDDIAATLQRSLLPTLPELDGYACAARYLVSQEQAQVGGDWYDVFALPDGAVGVAVGDVMGHDVAAAAAMGQLRSVLRSYAYEGSSPSVVLDRLDRLVQGFEMAQVATAIFGRLDRDEAGATLRFASAGHLPPIVRRPDGRVRRLDLAASPLIGVLPPGGRGASEAAVPLPSGSLLLLYTDGLVESRTRPHDAGIAQLCAALAGTDLDADPEEVVAAMVARMLADGQDDDVALLAIRVT